MKKTLLTITLIGAVASAFGQGAVYFSNGVTTKTSTEQVGVASTLALTPTTPGLIEFGLFYGIGESTSLSLVTSAFGVNSTTGAGIIAGSGDAHTTVVNVAIPGSSAAETDTWVQMRAWSASYGTDWASAQAAFTAGTTGVYWGATAVRNANQLNDFANGSGTAIWQNATGTNARLLNAMTIMVNVPEPSTLDRKSVV